MRPKFELLIGRGPLLALLVSPTKPKVRLGPDARGGGAIYGFQDFSILDGSDPKLRGSVNIRLGEYPQGNPNQISGNARGAHFTLVGTEVAGLDPAKRYLLLVAKPNQSAHYEALAIQPVETKKLSAKGDGKAAFVETLFDELARRPLKDSYELYWNIGMLNFGRASDASFAFVSRDPTDVDIAEYALSLAQRQQDAKRVYLDFLGGRWGSAEGYEPFFAALRPLLVSDPKSISVKALRVLAGSGTLGEKFDLSQELRGMPPTRSNTSMLHFAFDFEDRPDLMAFLTEFVQFAGDATGLNRADIVRAYVSTDKLPSFADRYEIYQGISRFFEWSAGIDATPENIKLTMDYPNGLTYPGGSNYTESEWKRVVDVYLGVQRPIHP